MSKGSDFGPPKDGAREGSGGPGSRWAPAWVIKFGLGKTGNGYSYTKLVASTPPDANKRAGNF